MKVRTPIRRAWRTVPLFAAAALGACDAGDGPTAPSPESAAPVDPIVVAGRVDVAAAPAGVPATTSAPGDPSGLLVTLEGTGAVDTTDARGNFRLEGRVEDGRVRLRFRRGALDVSLELEGVTPGAMLRLEVVLENEGASVTRARQGARAEAEGLATLLEVGGEEPGRVIRVQVRDEDDGRVTTAEVEIAEGVTRLDPEGDLTSFADLLAALEAGVEVELEGEGALQEDGSIAAAEVKAETED